MPKEILLASELITDDTEFPEITPGNKSPTLNGMGHVFFTVSPIAQCFLDKECLPGRRVIDIGTGYNNIPIIALENGVSEYLANDSSMEHLALLVQKAKNKLDQETLSKLKLLPGKAPEALLKLNSKYDAILADKVIHFLSPQEIDIFIEWTKTSLKKGGKIYIVAASPYSRLYKKSLLPEYLERLKAKEKYPGHISNIMDKLDDEIVAQNYNQHQVPNEMVLFSRNDLIELLTRHGLKILESYSFNIPTENEEKWMICKDEESNVVGVVAMKE